MPIIFKFRENENSHPTIKKLMQSKDKKHSQWKLEPGLNWDLGIPTELCFHRHNVNSLQSQKNNTFVTHRKKRHGS